MANIVVTSTTNSIKAAFNDLASIAKAKKGVWHKSRISFQLAESGAIVKVLVFGETEWAISFDGSINTLQIDSVDGVAPTSNDDLFSKLETLLI